MINIIRLFVLLIIFPFAHAAYASYVNTCLLTGELLEAPAIMIKSINRVDNSGEIMANSEYETSDFELKLWITESKIAGRADSGCQLPNHQPYELLITLANANELTDAKKGDQIKLLHIIKNSSHSPTNEEYILQQ